MHKAPPLLLLAIVAILSQVWFGLPFQSVPPTVTFVGADTCAGFVVIRAPCRVVSYSRDRRILRDTVVALANFPIPQGRFLSLTPSRPGSVFAKGTFNPVLSLTQ